MFVHPLLRSMLIYTKLIYHCLRKKSKIFCFPTCTVKLHFTLTSDDTTIFVWIILLIFFHASHFHDNFDDYCLVYMTLKYIYSPIVAYSCSVFTEVAFFRSNNSFIEPHNSNAPEPEGPGGLWCLNE